MNSQINDMIDAGLRRFTERERKWWKNDRRGRWVVLEPGIGRLLKGQPQHIRDFADNLTERRGRRFSSLSRARRFAREVGGVVRHWHRQMPARGPWIYITNPWQLVARTGPWVRGFVPKLDLDTENAP